MHPNQYRLERERESDGSGGCANLFRQFCLRSPKSPNLFQEKRDEIVSRRQADATLKHSEYYSRRYTRILYRASSPLL
jgi:hypothetical protein